MNKPTLMCLAVALLSVPASGLAWKKDMHGWMLGVAMRELSCLDANSNIVSTDATWADTSYAHNGSGVRYKNEEYYLEPPDWLPGNLAHAWFPSSPRGQAPQNAKGFQQWAHYSNSSQPYRGRFLGRGVHYIQDLGQPFHTYHQTFCQREGHLQYEDWAANNWSSGYNFRGDFLRGIRYQKSNNSPSKSRDKNLLAKDLAGISKQWAYMGKLCSASWTPRYKSNPQATRDLMYLTGRYTAAYLRGNKICN